MTIFYTYIWFDPKDNTPRYVGKGKAKRAWDHAGPKRKSTGVNKRLQNMLRARRRFGWNPQPYIIEMPSEKEALDLEVFFVAFYGREDLGKGTLFNNTDGGEGTSGIKRKPRTKEHTEKIASQARGRKRGPRSPETIQKTRATRIANDSYKHTDETKEKLSKIFKGISTGPHNWTSPGMTGHKHSEESKAKMSAGHKGSIPWNKGIAPSEETKEKIRQSVLASNAAKKANEINKIERIDLI